MTDWLLEVRDASLQRVVQVDDWVSADLVVRFNRPGGWRLLGLPAAGAAAVAFKPGSGFIATRGAVTFLSGPLDWPARRWDLTHDHLDVAGPDDLCHLWDRIAHPVPATGVFSSAAYDIRTGVAGTIVRQYVDVNAGPSALSSRRVPGLTLAVDAALGSAVTGRARLQQLGDLLTDLALSGGDLGFSVAQSGAGIVFDVYQPRDLTSSVIFSADLENLGELLYDQRAPTVNHVYVGGGGEGTARTFVEGSDSASISSWNRRIEQFVDQRQTSDAAELAQKRDEELAAGAERTTLAIGPVDTDAFSFGSDYRLGDQVTCVVDGVAIRQVIREVRVELTPAGEKVTPVLGSPRAVDPSRSLFEQVRQLAVRVNNQERR